MEVMIALELSGLSSPTNLIIIPQPSTACLIIVRKTSFVLVHHTPHFFHITDFTLSQNPAITHRWLCCLNSRDINLLLSPASLDHNVLQSVWNVIPSRFVIWATLHCKTMALLPLLSRLLLTCKSYYSIAKAPSTYADSARRTPFSEAHLKVIVRNAGNPQVK